MYICSVVAYGPSNTNITAVQLLNGTVCLFVRLLHKVSATLALRLFKFETGLFVYLFVCCIRSQQHRHYCCSSLKRDCSYICSFAAYGPSNTDITAALVLIGTVCLFVRLLHMVPATCNVHPRDGSAQTVVHAAAIFTPKPTASLASRAADLGFDSRLRSGALSGSSHTSDLVFTLHHWADELLNAANSQGRGGPRDPTAKCIPSQGQLVG